MLGFCVRCVSCMVKQRKSGELLPGASLFCHVDYTTLGEKCGVNAGKESDGAERKRSWIRDRKVDVRNGKERTSEPKS